MEQARQQEIRTVGTRIHYTGDMANSESFGTVTKVLENDKYNYNQIEIAFDDERFEGDTKKATVCLSGFSNGPGCRFSLEREWKANQQAAMDKYMELKNATKEYFCHSCGQLRLSVLHTPKTCLNCGQDNITVGLPGELDKDALKAKFAN